MSTSSKKTAAKSAKKTASKAPAKKTAATKAAPKKGAGTHVINKSAKTGEIVSKSFVKKNPDTTYATKVKDPTPPPAKKAAAKKAVAKKAATPVKKVPVVAKKTTAPKTSAKFKTSASPLGLKLERSILAAPKPTAPVFKTVPTTKKSTGGLTPLQQAQKALTGKTGVGTIESNVAFGGGFQPNDTQVAAARRIAGA